MKTTQSRITVDIPTVIHKKFKSLAANKGVSMREMIVEYIETQISLENGAECPYSHTPNKATLKALKDAREGKGLICGAEADAITKKLGL